MGCLADQSPSTYHELLKVAEAVNKLRESRGIQAVVPFKLLRHLGILPSRGRAASAITRSYWIKRSRTSSRERKPSVLGRQSDGKSESDIGAR